MTKAMKFKFECLNCDRTFEIDRSNSVIFVPDDWCFAINLPGFICEDCIHEVLNVVPDPPGLISMKEITPELIFSAITSMGFINDVYSVGNFFTKLFPESSIVIDSTAVMLHQSGHKEMAYDILYNGIETCDDPNRLRLELAALYDLDGQSKEALKIIRDIPNTIPRYYVIKGNIHRAMDKWNEACECWLKAIEIDSVDEIPWYNVGFYYTRLLQDNIAAIKHYTEASKTFPSNRKFRAYLGDAYFFIGDKEKAKENYEIALTIADNDENFETGLLRMLEACNSNH
jgi:tetratricopeptide (TPR) repeat protein